MQTPAVRDLVRANGPSILPITMIDGEIVKKQKYPKYVELTPLLEG
jgi:hypothetical protein